MYTPLVKKKKTKEIKKTKPINKNSITEPTCQEETQEFKPEKSLETPFPPTSSNQPWSRIRKDFKEKIKGKKTRPRVLKCSRNHICMLKSINTKPRKKTEEFSKK